MSPELRTWLHHLVTTARFTPVRLREGYDMGEVDRLLDDVVEAIDADRPLGPVVAGASLTRGRWRETYEMGEVDAFLDRLVAESEERTDTRVPGSPAAADPGVVQEQRGLLGRLFGR